MEAGGVMENIVTMEKLPAALTPVRDMAAMIQVILDRISEGMAGGVSADSVRQHALSVLYPVGSVYLSASGTSPASFLGGTWEQIKDVFLESGTAANAGTAEPKGEAQHALTVEEMPAHSHKKYYGVSRANLAEVTYPAANQSYENATISYYYSSQNYTGVTSSTGGSGAHNNLPPYQTMMMWKRVA